MDFPLYFQKRISPGHHFKINLEGWNCQDLLSFMQTITGSFCWMIEFFFNYHPPLLYSAATPKQLEIALHGI